MTIRQVLFSFKGTIPRKQWWIYTSITLILLFWIIFPALFILLVVLTLPMVNKASWVHTTGIIIEVIAVYAILILAIWCFSALNIKRLRERGHRWLMMTILLILSFMFYMAILSIPNAIIDLVYSQDFYSLIIFLLFFTIGLWPLIELGFLARKIEDSTLEV